MSQSWSEAQVTYRIHKFKVSVIIVLVLTLESSISFVDGHRVLISGQELLRMQ